jgi:hypothetical protein
MKTQSKWLIACTSICLVSSSAFAAIEFGLSASENDYNSMRSSFYSETVHNEAYGDSRKLVGATVRDPQGHKLGRIHEIVRNRNGEEFAAINVGGGNYALVPVRAMTVTNGKGILSRTEVTLNASKEPLQNGPTVRYGDWAQLDDPSFSQRIYSHYQVTAPPAVGGVGGGSLGGSSTGEQQNPKQQ